MSTNLDYKYIPDLTDDIIMGDAFPLLFKAYFTDCLQDSLAAAREAGQTLHGIIDGEFVEIPADTVSANAEDEAGDGA